MDSSMDSNRIIRHNNSSLSKDRSSDLSSSKKKNNNGVHQQNYLGKQTSSHSRNFSKINKNEGDNSSINRSCSIEELKVSLAKEIASEKK